MTLFPKQHSHFKNPQTLDLCSGFCTNFLGLPGLLSTMNQETLTIEVLSPQASAVHKSESSPGTARILLKPIGKPSLGSLYRFGDLPIAFGSDTSFQLIIQWHSPILSSPGHLLQYHLSTTPVLNNCICHGHIPK